MKSNSLLISLLLFACIDAIAVPPKTLMKSAAGSGDGAADIRIQQGAQSIDGVNAGHSINDANQQISVIHTNFGPLPDGSKQSISPEMQSQAAESGNLEDLRYLIDKKGKILNYEQLISSAGRAKSSDPNYFLNLLKYIHGEKGLPITNEIYDRIMYAADEAENSNSDYWLNLLLYLHGELGIPITDRIYEKIMFFAGAAKTSDPNYFLNLVKYIHGEKNVPISEDIYYRVMGNGGLGKAANLDDLLNFITYLHDEKRMPITKRIYDKIIYLARKAKSTDPNSMFRVLNYLHVIKGVPIPRDLRRFERADQEYLKFLKSKGGNI